MTTPENDDAGSGCPATTCSLSLFQIEELRQALWIAGDDIRQHLQVARYNLTGECAGQIMDKPDPPQLIHAAGIAESERVLGLLQKQSLKLSDLLSANTPDRSSGQD